MKRLSAPNALSENADTQFHSVQLGCEGSHYVLIHGWGHSLEQMRTLGELLAQNHRVKLIDLPGFGASPIPSSTWGAADFADALAAHLRSLAIDRATFVGHSFGGKISACLAARHPDLVDSLVLINSSGLRPIRSGKQSFRFRCIRLTGKFLKLCDRVAGTKLHATWFTPRYASADYLQAGPMRPILVRAVNEEIAGELSQISSPTLLLWGMDDRDTPVEIGVRMNELITGSKLVLLPDKGHNMVLDSGAHLCAYHLRKFMHGVSV